MFSPSFAEDHTVFGIADEFVYRSTDSGETWEQFSLPVSLHDADVQPEIDLLSNPSFGDNRGGRVQNDRSFDTPIGALSARRVAMAVALALATFVASTIWSTRSSAGATTTGAARSRVVWVTETLSGRLLAATWVFAVTLITLAA